MILAFASCQHAVMTRRTRSEHLIVINRDYRRPDRAVVAGFAYITRLNVRWAFAGSVATVMAAEAIVHDVCVVKVGRRPCDGGVTVIAVIAAGNVLWVFARCGRAIMTRATRANHLCMVNGVRWYPNCWVVTVLAYIACLDVCRMFTGRIHAIVAIKAIARNVYVIEIRG